MIDKKPLVSVITITWNRGALLKRCIDSVLGQTYENIEHIVVDGASTDCTDDVASQIHDPRFKYIKLESNWPIVDTINHGVSNSRGQYITFLDSDDEYVPEKIEKQLALIETLPKDYGMVYCWMSYFDNQTKKFLYVHKNELRGAVGDMVVDKPQVSGTPTYFFRRHVFEELGGWRDRETIGIISDWELAARCCQKYKVDYVPESLVNVYINHGSERMSDGAYNQQNCLNAIKFAKYFLSEFSDVFSRFPERGISHYYSIVSNSILLGNYSEAWKYYKILLKYRFTMKHCLSYFYFIYKRIRNGNPK